jgi:hypothetical protein
LKVAYSFYDGAIARFRSWCHSSPRRGRNHAVHPEQGPSGPIDQDHWTDEALTTLGSLFRGATAFPPGKGVWRDDSRGGALLRETTVMVVSYVPQSELRKNLPQLRDFLHRFGRETNQGEVGVIISGVYYGISKYD